MRDPLTLSGCTPEPLMGYLKALGMFRLVAEQADPTATLSWAGGVARLHTTLNCEGLTDFFLTKYKPTPVTSPWNGGSGYYKTWDDKAKRFRSREAVEWMNYIRTSDDERLSPYRRVLSQIDETLRGYAAPINVQTMPEKERKATLLLSEDRGIFDADQPGLLPYLRATLPDEAVGWLDTVLLLQADDTRAAPLFISGGNDGNFDFSVTFVGCLQELLADSEAMEAQFLSSVYAEGLHGIDGGTAGHFNPGGLGGPNGGQGFSGRGGVNPWDYVLMVEGALLLAGAVTRRLGIHAGDRVAFPFCASPVATGFGSAASIDETSDGCRTELWLPLWSGCATLPEVRYLFAEGRAQLGRRQARNAVEFALSTCLLGVSRGIDSFVRYGFLRRFGKMFLAAPLGRVAVTPRPAARLLEDPALTGWLDQLRKACREKDKTPARYQTALRQIDRAMFEFANRSEHGNDAKYLLNVLAALGKAERTLAGGLRFCTDKYIRPLQGLSLEWLVADGISEESEDGRAFRLAASLASIFAELKTDVGPFRTHLEPVEQKGSWVNWSPGSNSAVWTGAGLASDLVAVFLRRWVESERDGVAGVALRSRITAPLMDVIAFLSEQPDPKRDERFVDLLWALIGLDWTNKTWFQDRHNRERLKKAFHTKERFVVPAEFAALRLIAQPVGFTAARGPLSVVRGKEQPFVKTTPVVLPFHRLRVGELSLAATLAGRRLHADQLSNDFGPGRNVKPDLNLNPMRILAACLFPLSTASLDRLAVRVLTAAKPTVTR